LNETNVKQKETQEIASLVTHDLGLLAKQLETIVDAITPGAPTEKPTVTCIPVESLAIIKPEFKRLNSKELDQLGSDVTRLRQLTHDDFVAKQAVADAQATRDITTTCYYATCLHARQAADYLEYATICFNFRQGQANSPDSSDFATEVVHDPTDCTFLGGLYTKVNTQPPPPVPESATLLPPTPPSQTDDLILDVKGPFTLPQVS
jgi:hypothetical protein